MASNSYLTSADLVASVKRRAAIPESQVTFTEQDFLDLANEEMAIGLVPSILQFHEEYLVTPEDITLVNGQLKYPIPYRAIGNKLRELCWVDNSGNEYPMTRVNPEDAYDGGPYSSAANGISRFKIEGGNIVLLNSSNSLFTGTLRCRYFIRPNILVKMNRAAEVASIDRTTGVITFSDEIPDNFTASALYDFNRTKSDHRIITYDIPLISLASMSITVDVADIPDSLEIGDHICQAGETVIPNIPTDLHVVLTQRVGTRCLESMGDTQGLQNANAKLQEMETKTGNLIDNRTEGNVQKVINRTSMLRSGISGRWGRRGR